VQHRERRVAGRAHDGVVDFLVQAEVLGPLAPRVVLAHAFVHGDDGGDLRDAGRGRAPARVLLEQRDQREHVLRILGREHLHDGAPAGKEVDQPL